MPPVHGAVAEIKTVNIYNNQWGLNVHHYVVLNPPATAYTDQQYADVVCDAFQAAYQPICGSSSLFAGVMWRYANTGAYNPTTISTHTVGPNLRVGTILPSQVTGMVTKKTATPGRAGRGRIYVPFPTDNDIDTDDTPSPGYVADLTTFAGSVLTLMTLGIGGGADTFQLSPILANRGLTTLRDVTGFLVRKRWATQRKRGNYGRLNPSFP